jgi:hypothetical protein
MLAPILIATIVHLSAASGTDRPTVLVIVGAPGAAQYEQAFGQWADRWEQAAAKAGATPVCIGRGASAGTTDLARLKEALAEEPKHSAEPLWIVLVGHGTFDGRRAKFNLRGQDLAADDLVAWLEPFHRPVAVINCASSSAPWINALSAPGRVILTSTKSGYEQNFARFGDYLSSAILNPENDLDKDGQTSLLEAFLAASRGTAEFYQQESRLATETALIDDNGDGLGTPAAWFRGIHATRQAQQGASLDGALAHQWHLLRAPAEERMPAELRARRDSLEQAVAQLRQSKGQTLDEEDYYARLEPLLVELARLYEALGTE